MFAESKKLKAVDLSGVTKFEVKGNSGKGSESPFLFRNSNIEKVTLPSWQFTIGESWFDGCSKLEEVEFKGTTPPHLTNRYSLASQYSVSNHFNSINSNVVFRVPSGAVRNYIEPTGTGMDNGYAYYEFANTSGNYLFRNGTYYITDGTVTAVGINRAAEAISNVSTNGQTIIIGGSISDSQWQELNTALAGATFPVTLDFSMQSFTSFGTWFKNSQNLSGIVLPQNVTAIDADAFNGCSALALFEVPAGVTTIGAGAFSGCSSLSTVTVAENSNLKKIGERAFQNSGLTEITIPAGVMRIGAGAFSGTNLASVSGFNANDWLEVVNGTNTAINLNGQSVAEYLKNCSNQLVNKETTWDESECYQFHNTITLLPETTTGTNGANSRYVYFGDYPRTHKASDVIVDEDKEKTVGAFTYYLGSDKNYYVKHRVVRNSYYYDDGSNVENTGEYAYFKVEPIKWRVLTTDYNGTGKALLMADNATAGYFDYIESGRAFFYYKKNNNDGNYGNRTIDGETIYPNNYEYSNIRAWLNGYDGSQYDDDLADWTNCGFLQSAFTSSAQNLIVQTTVDNSKEQCFEPDALNIESNTSFDEYLSGNTNDKVFLLSKREVTTHNYGFDDGTVQYGSRVIAPTDYAKASYIGHYNNNGVYYGCEWWLRTPQVSSYNNGTNAMTVSNIGYAANGEGVEQSMYAVVPAICVDLSAAGIELTAGAGNPAFENGALTIGKFKVSATGKTVQFSQGNLQYKQNSNFKTYHFADYQYHSIGNYGDKFSADNTSSYNRRDLFLSSRFTSFSDLGIIETNYDDWCELSADEWQFLLSREGKSGVATIDGNNGLILLPDNWTAPEGIVFAAGFVGAEDDYGKNNHYTAAQWAKMEQAGAVFLPAAGSFGWKMNVQNQVLTGYERNVSGLYWSAKNDQGKRSLVWFNKTHAEILTSTELASGDQLNDLAVRLVREVEPESNNGSTGQLPNWMIDAGDGHYYVDLGLPNGTLWATTNVGAASITDAGTDYSWCVDNAKASINANYSESGATLLPTDDQATVNWNANWVTPTKSQLDELYDNCYFEPVRSYNGVTINGYKVFLAKDHSHTGLVEQANAFLGDDMSEYIKDGYSDSDPHIFLPARNGGNEVWMWSSTYGGIVNTAPYTYLFGLADQWYDIIEIAYADRESDYGDFPIRPVYVGSGNSVPQGFALVEGGIIEPYSWDPYYSTLDDDPNTPDVNESNFISIPDMFVCKHEVTQTEWEKYMTYYGVAVNGTDEGQSGSEKPCVPNASDDKDNTPVYYISWVEAIAYCNLRSIAENLNPVYSILIDGVKETNPANWSVAGIVADANGKYYSQDNVVGYNIPSNESYWCVYEPFGGKLYYDETATGYRLPNVTEWVNIATKNSTDASLGIANNTTVEVCEWCRAYTGINATDGNRYAMSSIESADFDFSSDGLYYQARFYEEWDGDILIGFRVVRSIKTTNP